MNWPPKRATSKHRPRPFDEGDAKLKEMLSRTPRNPKLVRSWSKGLWGDPGYLAEA